MMELTHCLLGDVLTLQRGFDLPAAQRIPGSVPIISSSGWTGVHAEARVDGPGVVIGRYGTLGSVHFIDESFWPLNTTLYVRDFKGNDPRFCAYLLSTLNIAGTSGASAVPGVNRNVLHLLPVAIPRSQVQWQIAAVLRAYDDLIEVNRRRIDVLESMARGLFEEWFVRFRFSGHEAVTTQDAPEGQIPAGWSYAGLHDVANIAFGMPFASRLFSTKQSGTKVVRIRDIPSGDSSTWTTEPFDMRYEVRNGDLLVGMDGIFHTEIWCGGDAALNQRVTRLRPLDGRSASWLIQSVKPQIKHLEATITGTTVAHLSARDLRAMKVLVAPVKLQHQCDSFFAPIDGKLLTLRLANQRLAAARDFLLPRLLSGRLTLPAAERELADAA